MGQKFGATNSQPLLVAVRSGASVSMPGMLDTILNIGLNDQVVEALAARTSARILKSSIYIYTYIYIYLYIYIYIYIYI
jgi:phosphoenolpyruvate synthase/pyruvate phosphate dikinase